MGPQIESHIKFCCKNIDKIELNPLAIGAFKEEREFLLVGVQKIVCHQLLLTEEIFEIFKLREICKKFGRGLDVLRCDTLDFIAFEKKGRLLFLSGGFPVQNPIYIIQSYADAAFDRFAAKLAQDLLN